MSLEWNLAFRSEDRELGSDGAITLSLFFVFLKLWNNINYEHTSSFFTVVRILPMNLEPFDLSSNSYSRYPMTTMCRLQRMEQ
jgi:hypothetical protein